MTTGEIDLIPTFKSKFELEVYNKLVAKYKNVTYEEDSFTYFQPVIQRTYTPDFRTHKSKQIFLEVKGKLDLETRKKMIWFRDCHPEIIIIFLFMNPTNKITKRSKTTYSDWADKQGFLWLDGRKDWLKEYTEILKSENPTT